MPVRRPPSTRLLAVIATLVAACASFASPALAADASNLNQAKSDYASAQAEANKAAAAFASASDELEHTQERKVETEARIAELEAQAAALSDVARKRALYAYRNAGQELDMVVDAGNPVEAARREKLLDRANQQDNLAVQKLGDVNADLAEETAALKKQEAQQQQVAEQLAGLKSEMNAKLAAAESKRKAAQGEYDSAVAREQDEARKAELANQAAALAAARSSSSNSSGGGSSTPVANAPVVGGFTCPVYGSAYNDDFGGARGHGGIDMFAPTGQPAFAVKSGFVTFTPNEGAGGNAAYLNASDGNTYYYAHFSAYAGASGRSVSQGENIGFVGATGNAQGAHLHFEIRAGGANGGRINPYPTLRASGC